MNIPDISLVDKTDYCGLVTGKNTDKSKLFEVFFGQIEHAPMIRQCPVCMACRLADSVAMPTNTFYIGEIIEAYSQEQYLTKGKPDVKKIRPFTLTMPDNNYWDVGTNIGKAWGIGAQLIKK